jgi:hypothetical protein
VASRKSSGAKAELVLCHRRRDQAIKPRVTSAARLPALGHCTMRPFEKKPQMTSAEFSAALREAGFGVERGRIVDVSGRCPGFATLPSFNKAVVDRNATLSKVIWERDAEIRRRASAGRG